MKKPRKRPELTLAVAKRHILKLSADVIAARLETAKHDKYKDEAYHERNMCVAALSKVWPAHLMRHQESDTRWSDDWRWIVCIDVPTGQCAWHIHDKELVLFDHLERHEANDWDGHTTAEKYARLARLENGAVFKGLGANIHGIGPGTDGGLNPDYRGDA